MPTEGQQGSIMHARLLAQVPLTWCFGGHQCHKVAMAHCVALSQVWPNYLHEAQFPQSVLRPNEAYRHKWYLRFYTKPAAAAPALGPSSVAVKNAASVKPAPAPGL